MFKDKNLNNIIDVTNKLIDIVSSKHIAASRIALAKYSKSLKDEHKVIFDTIISYAMQYQGKQLITRYSIIPPDDKYLEDLDNLLIYFDKDVYNRLPHILQKTMYLCSSTLIYRTNHSNLRKLLSNYYTLKVVNTNKCKRCYTETEDILCALCSTKLSNCVEFINESFNTIGTTVEAFEYYFKDWQVVVNNYGDYKFIRLKDSPVTYQPKLGIKEYQNLSGLIG